MIRTIALLAILSLPAPLLAQARIRPDPKPARTPEWSVAGAQVKQRPMASPRRPIAAQFDSLGFSPLGERGDPVTVYLFPDGQNLGAVRHARITLRQRFDPPASWRAACDEVAHPGWFFSLDAPPTSQFGVVVAGTHPKPEWRTPPPSVFVGGRAPFLAFADSAWQRYVARMKPATEREYAFLWYAFHTEAKDAGWERAKRFGVRGPNGHNYAVFSFWLRDDSKDGTPNTVGTWIVDAWGRPVAQAHGNVDIYGTVDADGDGIDAVVTSSGLIRWNGNTWVFPRVYSDEPCLARRNGTPPPGVRP